MRSREEKKKCKGQESTIGKIIYSFLLFLPLLAIGVTCGYAMFNKNAYQSYMGSAEYLNTVTYSNYIQNKPVTAQTYTLNNTDFYYYSATSFNNIEISIPGSQISYMRSNWLLFNCNEITIDGTLYTNIKSAGIHQKGANIQVSTYNVVIDNNYYYINDVLHYLSNDTIITSINNSEQHYNNTITLSCRLSNNNIYCKTTTWNNTNPLTYANFDIYLNDTTVSSVFYSSIEKIQQSPLFNWAKNSIIYTTTATTCNALSITTPFIPLLMSYWLIISIIYFLYDIALMLVWIIHKKIHELQESI